MRRWSAGLHPTCHVKLTRQVALVASNSRDKSGGDKSGGDKSGGDKSGGDKSGGDKSRARGAYRRSAGTSVGAVRSSRRAKRDSRGTAATAIMPSTIHPPATTGYTAPVPVGYGTTLRYTV